jgi:hypothetical protein
MDEITKDEIEKIKKQCGDMQNDILKILHRLNTYDNEMLGVRHINQGVPKDDPPPP